MLLHVGRQGEKACLLLLYKLAGCTCRGLPAACDTLNNPPQPAECEAVLGGTGSQGSASCSEENVVQVGGREDGMPSGRFPMRLGCAVLCSCMRVLLYGADCPPRSLTAVQQVKPAIAKALATALAKC